MFIKKISLNKIKEFNKGGVFNSFEWLSVYDVAKLFIWGIFNKNEEIIGVFSTYNHKRAKVFNQLAPPPFMPTNSLFVVDETLNPANKNTFNKKVMETLSEFLDAQKSAIKTFYFPVDFKDMQPFIWKGYDAGIKYTYQLNLSLSEEDLLANMSGERRKNIKKALKDDLVVKQEVELSVFKNLIVNTFKSQKIKIDYKVLTEVLTRFFNQENALALVSYNKLGEPLSASLTVFDDNRAYYLFGGYDKTNKHEGAGALAMWEAIKIAKHKGVSVFDFEGSMIPQVETYFRGFGGDITPYYFVKKSSLVPKSILKI